MNLNMSKRLGLAVFIFGMVLSLGAKYAEANLVVYIETRVGDHFSEPVNHQIYVETRPLSFSVVLKNLSSSSEQIYRSVADGYSSISFELLGQDNKKKYIRRKKTDAADFQSITHLSSGQVFSYEMLLNARDWEGLAASGVDKGSKLRGRAIYDNNGTKIYSEYYEIIFPDSLASQEKEIPKSERKLSS